jgi:glyoxylate reductase
VPSIVLTSPLPVDAASALPGATITLVDPDTTAAPDTAARGSAPAAPAALRAALAGADALICLPRDRISADLLDAAPRLRVVANTAVGTDNVDVAAASARGIAVTNTPDVLTEATADFAFLLALAAARRLGQGERLVRAGAWRGWSLDHLLGVDLAGATLGIIGLGRIGRAVARRASGFGMAIVHTGGAPDATTPPVRAVPLDELLAIADIVSIHCPLTADTRHLIDAAALARMKPTAVLVNTARGPIVDEAAVADALDAGRLFAAGLDVFAAEPRVHPHLLASDRAVLAPHLGSATTSVRTQMATLSLAAVRSVLADERPAHLVDPSMWPRRRGAGP